MSLKNIILDKARQPLGSAKPDMPYTNNPTKKKKDGGGYNVGVSNEPNATCLICGKNDHKSYVSAYTGWREVSYYACEKFISSSPAARCKLLDDKGYCRKCLRVGVKRGHKSCYDTYACKHPSHRSGEGYHVLVCDEHKKSSENDKLLNEFKDQVIKKFERNLPASSQKIKISFYR